ncbi:hint-domain-containing protein [Hypoxylon sp. NC1633]|nr:hint-domain-containing protein [Hypoxylon sp. NC1633]
MDVEDAEDVSLSIHPIPSHDGVIVRVQPPEKPNGPGIGHIPCDIVLVIDVSGSMDTPAPAKMNGDDGAQSEDNFGLSILDLVKHAARTILSTLDEGDRLGIVIQRLLPMTSHNKAQTELKIESMESLSMTNLWHGIQQGIGLFEGEETGRVPAVMILTDGVPNHMCPVQGYVPKIRSKYETLPTTLHTFGFGYELRSGLLKSIAEVGGGSYAFIPDAGMIGTVFVHAVAHIQTTFATKCTLELTTAKSMGLKTMTGQTVDRQEREEKDCKKLTIDLGNLQYGQSRDIYLENFDIQGHKVRFDAARGVTVIAAMLRYSRMNAWQHYLSTQRNVLEAPDLPEYEIAYHQSRSMICNFLSSLLPLREDGEYKTPRHIDSTLHKPSFQRLLESIPARQFDDEYNKSLMKDLEGPLPAGQVKLALSNAGFFRLWGCHYFFSLWDAHAKQRCNTFKDPGPLLYNRGSFFARCRNALDSAFDSIPPPKPSCIQVATTSHVNMARLNDREGPCFTGSSKVTLASGQQIPVRKLRRGSRVLTPAGDRRVAMVLKTMVRGIVMCKIDGLVVTPYHPVRTNDTSASWVFPATLLGTLDHARAVLHSGPIYSVLLQPNRDVEAHALQIGGIWAVTLGHGLVRGNDIRAHPFLGSYREVVKAIAWLQPGKDGVALSSGVERRQGNGLVCGFKKYVPPHHRAFADQHLV